MFLHQVSVHVERDADRRVTHELLNPFRMHVLRDEKRCKCVAQVVEAHVPQLGATQGRVEAAAQQDSVVEWAAVVTGRIPSPARPSGNVASTPS